MKYCDTFCLPYNEGVLEKKPKCIVIKIQIYAEYFMTDLNILTYLWSHDKAPGVNKIFAPLKQNNVTLTATRGFRKGNLMMHVYVTQNSNFSKIRSRFMEKMFSGFPSDVLQLLCLNSDSLRALKATCRLPAD